MGATYTDYEIIFPKGSTEADIANSLIGHIASILEWNVTKVATGTRPSSTNYAECTEPTKGYVSLRIDSYDSTTISLSLYRKNATTYTSFTNVTTIYYGEDRKSVFRIYKTAKGGHIIHLDKAIPYSSVKYSACGLIVLPVISLIEGNEDKLISAVGYLAPVGSMTLFSGDNLTVGAIGSSYRAYNDEVQMLTKCMTRDYNTKETIHFIEGLYSTAKALNVFEIGDAVVIGEKKYILVHKYTTGNNNLSYVDVLAELE